MLHYTLREGGVGLGKSTVGENIVRLAMLETSFGKSECSQVDHK